MSTITDITVSKIYVLNVAPKTRVLDRFWYDTTNKILKKCVSTDQSKTDEECWEPIGIDPSAINVTVENGQGTSTTLTLQNYVSAVAEGLIEISGQVTDLNNTKADKTDLNSKQDKLNYYNEGDNVVTISSDELKAKNIILGGYEREVEGILTTNGISVYENGTLEVEKANENGWDKSTIDGSNIAIEKYYTGDIITACHISDSLIQLQSSEELRQSVAAPKSMGVLGVSNTTPDTLGYSFSGVGGSAFVDDNITSVTNGTTILYSGLRHESVNNESGVSETEFFVGTKLNYNNDEYNFSQVIEGTLVDKELSEESLETHIPTSSAVVSYVDNQTTHIKEDITDLQQTKANNGEFYFEGGALTTTNRMPLNTPFTCVWTMAMTQEEFKNHRTFFPKFIGNLGYWLDAGYGWCINRVGNTLIGIGANNGGGSEKYNNLDITNYLDGNPHIWSVVYDETNISLYIDNVKKTSFAFTFESSEATNPLGIGSTPTSENQNYGVWGKFSRIKYFNFDMSSDDAPYTIADYISGKDESPLLNGGRDISLTTADVFTAKNCTITESENGLTFTATSEWANHASVKFPIVAGQKVEVSWEGKLSYTGIHNPILVIGSSAQALTSTSGQIVDIKNVSSPIIITAENTGDYLGILLNSRSGASAGDTATIKGLKIKVNGALLSLEDVKSGVQILDKSGNANHANISGTVYASKENNPARCVDSASFSWAGTMTTQKFANSDVAIPANSKVVAYAKASVGMSASFTCGSNSAVSKELSANTLTEIGSFLNASQGAFKVTPSSATTGKMEVYLTIEKF